MTSIIALWIIVNLIGIFLYKWGEELGPKEQLVGLSVWLIGLLALILITAKTYS